MECLQRDSYEGENIYAASVEYCYGLHSFAPIALCKPLDWRRLCLPFSPFSPCSLSALARYPNSYQLAKCAGQYAAIDFKAGVVRYNQPCGAYKAGN